MTWNYVPGEFPELTRREYQRLVALAKRRLVGREHHADDVVSLAILKWVRISPARRRVARIEQVIKSEAYSLIRSERRARERDTRAVGDRSSPLGGSARAHTDQDLAELRLALSTAGRQTGIELSAEDIEVFELINAGYNLSEIVRKTGLSRHTVRSSRLRLQHLIRATLNEPTTEPSPT